MLPWLEKLLEIQEVDLKMARIEQQLEEIPRLAEETKRFYLAESQAFEEAKKNAQSVELNVRKIEKEIDALKEQKKNLLSKSAIIKNNDEYRAALLQIEMCDRAVSDHETEILTLMDQLDEAKKTTETKRISLEEAKSRAQGAMDELRTTQTNCKAAIAALQGQRAELAAQMDANILRRYDRLHSAKTNVKTRPCVVPIELPEEGGDGCCGRCRVKLPPQLLANARKGETVFCSSCAAILYSNEIA